MTNQEQIMRQYLLGELNESEQETLERKYFSDQHLFEQMVQVENELVDQYARGLLSPAARDRFENYYLAHPRRRERAQFAEALATKVSEVNGAQTIASKAADSWWDRLSATVRGPKLAWAFSAAILLFAVLAGWFFIETKRLREELARTESERLARANRERELHQQVANEQLRAQQLSDELERMRSQQASAAPSPSPDRASTFATLILTIAGTRAGNGGGPAVLRIPAGAEQVRLQLNLRENNYSSYQILIQSASRNTVFTSRLLAAPKAMTKANLSLVIPAQRFTTGDYILTLRGANQSGEFEDVSKSLIQVEKM